MADRALPRAVARHSIHAHMVEGLGDVLPGTNEGVWLGVWLDVWMVKGQVVRNEMPLTTMHLDYDVACVMGTSENVRSFLSCHPTSSRSTNDTMVTTVIRELTLHRLRIEWSTAI